MKKIFVFGFLLAVAWTLVACSVEEDEREVDVMTIGTSGATRPTETTGAPESSRPATTTEPVVTTTLEITRAHDFEVIQFAEIDWLVLDEKDGKKLLLSDRFLESRPYYKSESDEDAWGSDFTNWEDSCLREYLNGEFYNSFSKEDKARIVKVTNQNPKNKWTQIINDTDRSQLDGWGEDGNMQYNVGSGKSTEDFVFVLNIEEVLKYFGDSGKAHTWTVSDYVWIDDEFNERRMAYGIHGEPARWWLRSPGAFGGGGTTVLENGQIDLINVDSGKLAPNGVRPAMWVTSS